MRAICCAILAIAFHQMMRTKVGNAPTLNDLHGAAKYVVLQYISIIAAVILCIIGL